MTIVVFALLLFGIVEFGTAFFDYLTTSNMTRSAARVGATLGNASSTDYQILQKIKSSTSGIPLAEIQRIVVYKASGVGAGPSGACIAGSVSSSCNDYTAADLNRPSSDFGCSATSPDRSWCPTTRVVSASGNSGAGPDYLGIYVQVLHPSATGLFGPSFTFKQSMVLKIEAETP